MEIEMKSYITYMTHKLIHKFMVLISLLLNFTLFFKIIRLDNEFILFNLEFICFMKKKIKK